MCTGQAAEVEAAVSYGPAVASCAVGASRDDGALSRTLDWKWARALLEQTHADASAGVSVLAVICVHRFLRAAQSTHCWDFGRSRLPDCSIARSALALRDLRIEQLVVKAKMTSFSDRVIAKNAVAPSRNWATVACHIPTLAAFLRCSLQKKTEEVFFFRSGTVFNGLLTWHHLP